VRGARRRPRLEARQKMSPRPEKLGPRGECAVGPDVGQRRKFGAPFSVAQRAARSLMGTPSSTYADYLVGLEGLENSECLEYWRGIGVLKSRPAEVLTLLL